MKRTWHLNTWWEKTIYVFGCVVSIFYVIAFLAGFFIGVTGG